MKKMIAQLAVIISLVGYMDTSKASTPIRPVALIISALGIGTTIIPLGLASDGSLAVPADGRTAGWFTGGPRPGQIGPAVIVAHVDWKGTKGPFFYLRNARVGELITIRNSNLSSSVFVIIKVVSYKKSSFPTNQIYGNIAYAGLRLITCGTFDPKTHKYLNDLVVYAKKLSSN